MTRARLRPAVAVLVLVLSPRVHAGAGDIAVRGTCVAGTDFEAAGFSIRQARIQGPFMFLPWVRAKFAAAERGLAPMAGQPYRDDKVLEKARELEASNFLEDAREPRVRLSVVTRALENCADQKLDVVFSVFASQIDPVSSATFESRQTEKASPEQTAGTARVSGWRIKPLGGYGNAEHLFGGVSVEYQPPAAVLDSVKLEAVQSSTMHLYSADLSGSREPESGRIARVEWQFSGRNSLLPTGSSELKQNRLAGQLSAITRPLGRWRLPVRFGGELAFGRQDSNFSSATLPQNTVPASDTNGVKLYVGTTARFDRHALAASYGIELGAADSAERLDWIKQVVDLAHDFSVLVGDHRALELESRLSAGRISVPGSIPVSARFFGGSREEPFVLGDSWMIRGNPVIRSFPMNRLSPDASEAGGTRFAAFNLTAAVPVWRVPLVPAELSSNSELQDKLTGQLNSVRSIIAVTEFVPKDPHLALAAAKLGDLSQTLKDLGTAVAAAAETRPGELEELFEQCTSRVTRAGRAVQRAIQSEGVDLLNALDDLLTEDDGVLVRVHSACTEDLNAELHDDAIAARGAQLAQVRTGMKTEFDSIDQAAAERQAEAELAIVRRTLNTLMKELNVVAVSPVAGLDVATIGSAHSGSETRYGIGGGVRITLVNSADFTASYFANPKRHAGEPRGAFFFALRFRDLFE